MKFLFLIAVSSLVSGVANARAVTVSFAVSECSDHVSRIVQYYNGPQEGHFGVSLKRAMPAVVEATFQLNPVLKAVAPEWRCAKDLGESSTEVLKFSESFYLIALTVEEQRSTYGVRLKN